jgi:hypothetical protein
MPNAQNMITVDFEGRFANGAPGGGGFLNFMRIVEHLLEVPGDYNNDRYVDGADYVAWQSAYGQEGTGLAADGNHDGIVDGADYTIWRKAVAAVAPGAGAGAGLSFTELVPEPCACALAAVGLTGFFWNLPRRRP